MTANILFAAKPGLWPVYQAPLRKALDAAGVDHALATEMAPQDVDYIVYSPGSEVLDFTPYTRLKAVLNLWAGVESVAPNPTLRVPLARMVDHGLKQGMIEWVTGHVLRHHLGMDAHIHGLGGAWRQDVPPLAQDRGVSFLGLGELGRACAQALAGLGFDVAGWSRSPREVPGIACHHGPGGLEAVLKRADILVLLLPDTPATRDVLNAETLALLPRGSVVINPGRGSLVDEDALVAALYAGQVSHATLDVFRTEPLPEDHPFWTNPRITVTPHIASETRPETAAEVIAENVRRGEAGEPLLYLVDRGLGY